MAIRIAAAPLIVSDTGDGVEIDAVESDLKIAQRVDGHADAAHLPHRFRCIGIIAALRRQIEGDVQASLAVGYEIFEALVGVGGIGKAGVLPHRPRPVPVHQRMDAAGKRRLARPALVRRPAGGNVFRGVQRLYLDAAFVDDAA